MWQAATRKKKKKAPVLGETRLIPGAFWFSGGGTFSVGGAGGRRYLYKASRLPSAGRSTKPKENDRTRRTNRQINPGGELLAARDRPTPQATFLAGPGRPSPRGGAAEARRRLRRACWVDEVRFTGDLREFNLGANTIGAWAPLSGTLGKRRHFGRLRRHADFATPVGEPETKTGGPGRPLEAAAAKGRLMAALGARASQRRG